MLAVVMTCKRPDGAYYFYETSQSLIASGVLPMEAVHDGPHGHNGYIRGVRLGIVPTFRRAVFESLEITRQREPDEQIAVFQDDVQAARKNLGEYLAKTIPSERGVFSLYLSEGRTAPNGWSTIDDDGTYPLNVGACGIVMDAETARRFIESPPFKRTDRLGSQLVQWCLREKIPFWIHAPSLLVHTGKVSCS